MSAYGFCVFLEASEINERSTLLDVKKQHCPQMVGGNETYRHGGSEAASQLIIHGGCTMEK